MIHDATKIGNNTHLLVVMCMRLSQKIGLLDLTNQTRFLGTGRGEGILGRWILFVLLILDPWRVSEFARAHMLRVLSCWRERFRIALLTSVGEHLVTGFPLADFAGM